MKTHRLLMLTLCCGLAGCDNSRDQNATTIGTGRDPAQTTNRPPEPERNVIVGDGTGAARSRVEGAMAAPHETAQPEATTSLLETILRAGVTGRTLEDREAEQLRLLAEQGDARAQLQLGLAHWHGILGPKDPAEAAKWLRKAADQGNAQAQQRLGQFHLTGEGVPQDHAEAARWFREAANQGHAGAQFDLGVAYLEGEGMPQDHAEAVKWFRKAADQGLDRAQVNLGLSYALGRGVPKDEVAACMWLSLAAARGAENASKALDAVARVLTAEQLAEAQQLAREKEAAIARTRQIP